MSKGWSMTDNDTLVVAVPGLMRMVKPGQKALTVRGIMKQTGRSKGSVESKLMNVSGVFHRLGMPIVPGYAPLVKLQHDLFEAMKRGGLVASSAVLPPLARPIKNRKKVLVIKKSMGISTPFQHVPPTSLSSRTIKRRALTFSRKANRPEQRTFRQALFEYWRGCCPLTGISEVKLLEAAHRHGAEWENGDNEAHHGVLLCVDLHRLYDATLMKISDSGKVSMAPHLRNIPRYQGIHGQVIQGW